LFQSAAKVDTEFSLFGGGVTGKYVSLEPPSKIVQTWALQSPTWPAGEDRMAITRNPIDAFFRTHWDLDNYVKPVLRFH
jgi:activator of HSP90 ATPase